MRRFTIRVLALAVLCSAFALDVQAGGPVAVRGQADSPPAPTKESVDKAMANEYQVVLERSQVCLKLRTIAAKTGDEALREKADKLEEMAWKAYDLRILKLKNVNVAEAAPAEAVAERKPKPKPPRYAPNGRLIRGDDQ